MCGIVGFAGREPIDSGMLRNMCDVLSHRGPDDSGQWYSADGSVGLAHRRLAIIDLSPGGHQPMASESGTVHIAFNGEIYNYLELKRELASEGHSFRTASDTEVILEAYRHWGEGFVEHLGGMFALALYDEAKRTLFLARDRAGEKPLFIWPTAGRVVWGSELKAILAFPDAPRRIDRGALQHFLAWGYVPGDMCIFQGMAKVAPGTILRINVQTGEIRTRRYWDLPEYSESERPLSVDELEAELGELLLESVRRQMIADVPVGVLLSGGVDSSLITAMAARISSKPVKTFTITFPGHGALDEAPYAAAVARRFGTDHLELPAPTVNADILPMLMKQYDEPIADSSIVPTYLVSRLIRQHATVALGGDGGDELFGGYPSYVWALRIARAQSLVPSVLRRAASAVVQQMPITTRGYNYLNAIGEDGFGALQHIGLYFNETWRRRLLPDDAVTREPEEYRVSLATGAKTLLQAFQRIDFRSYMVDQILVKVDRASMLNSLEIRAPFLDPAVVEFAFGKVPDRLKTTVRERKVLLRRLAARFLPPELDLRRKQGFSIPIREWLREEWRDLVHEILDGSDLFSRKAIAQLFKAQEAGGSQGQRLFALVAFELWRKEYRAGL